MVAENYDIIQLYSFNHHGYFTCCSDFPHSGILLTRFWFDPKMLNLSRYKLKKKSLWNLYPHYFINCRRNINWNLTRPTHNTFKWYDDFHTKCYQMICTRHFDLSLRMPKYKWQMDSNTAQRRFWKSCLHITYGQMRQIEIQIIGHFPWKTSLQFQVTFFCLQYITLLCSKTLWPQNWNSTV